MGGPDWGMGRWQHAPAGDGIAGTVHEGEFVIPHTRPDLQRIAAGAMGQPKRRPMADQDPLAMLIAQGA